MRTFIALDIDPDIRQKIERFTDGIRAFAPDVRWVKPESLHVTLKFLGEQSPETVEKIKESLSEVLSEPFDLKFRDYGFFPTTKSARVFWVGIEAGPQLASLAAAIDEATAKLGIPKEDRAFSPHLTLARSGSGAPKVQKGDQPNRRFQQLQQKVRGILSAGFWYDERPRIFSVRKQLAARRSPIHKTCPLRTENRELTTKN
jgi:2'-5' RNA ligase